MSGERWEKTSCVIVCQKIICVRQCNSWNLCQCLLKCHWPFLPRKATSCLKPPNPPGPKRCSAQLYIWSSVPLVRSFPCGVTRGCLLNISIHCSALWSHLVAAWFLAPFKICGRLAFRVFGLKRGLNGIHVLFFHTVDSLMEAREKKQPKNKSERQKKQKNKTKHKTC